MTGQPRIVSPRDLDEAYAALAANRALGSDDAPQQRLRPIAGGTDLADVTDVTGLETLPDGSPRRASTPPTHLIDLAGLDALRGITLDGEGVVIGTLTTFTQIRRSPICREHLPGLVEAAAAVGPDDIQARATLGGNIATGSPAGDTLPVLLAMDATFTLGSTRGERRVPAATFWRSDRRPTLADDELLLRVRIPIAGRDVRFRKVGTAAAHSIGKVVLALAWQDGPAPIGWREVRVAVGSVATTPIRAHATEGVLEGRLPTPETADLAAETLAGEIHPLDDEHSTAAYRRIVAARLLHRMIRQAGGW